MASFKEDNTISFEMATELGLIPRPRDRYLTTQFPFESVAGYQARTTAGELGYRSELARIKAEHPTVTFRGETLEVI